MQEKPIESLIEKIAKECEEANAGKWTITKIVKELSSEEKKSMKNLRKKALEMLEALDPKAAAVYASFQRMNVRTSGQHIEAFDRGNIIKSLLKETEVPRGVAEKIGHEVEEKIKDLEIESISTPLIREMVNVKLLEFGHENIRNQYTRLGLPVFEVRKKLEQCPYSNKAILTDYCLLRVIPGKLGRMHLSNEIFIAELQDFASRPVAVSIEAEARETPKETVLGLLEKANILAGYFSWRPNLSALNVAVSAGAGKKSAKEAGLLFAGASKAVFLKGKAVPAFNTLHLFEPDSFSGKEIEKESMVISANAMLAAGGEEQSPAFESAVAVDTKYRLKLLRKRFPKIVLNCRKEELSLANGVAFEGKGLCSFTALNLNMIALECAGKEALFFEKLGEKARAIKQLDELKRKALGGRPYIKKQCIAVEALHSAAALDSLAEAGKIVTGAEKESEIVSFCEKIVAELEKSLGERFVLTELKNRTALKRFESQNRKSLAPERRRLDEGKILQKSSAICRAYSFVAKAGSRKELNSLIDGNARLIEFREKEKD